MSEPGWLKLCAFPPGELHLGVSGGADSVAMAVLAREAGRSFTIWHVNHGVRPSAAADEQFVAGLAESWNVPYEIRRVDLGDGANFEARARAERYRVLPAGVCVAHTANDRAETVLLNLLRGAGLSGAAARMSQAQRPILALTRADTEAVCQWAGIEPAVDETNADVRQHRAAIRHVVLPAIADSLGRDPTPILNRHADLMADALAVIESAAAELDPTDVRALRAAPKAVATEALRRWIRSETKAAYDIDLGSIDRVLAVVAGDARAAEVLGGHRVSRSQGKLSISLASRHGQART